ncbi:MAG: hypothetical protein IJO87_01630 [Eggerthellaceae bacterium]|nr:hypothetical protein [Eggerthellaceae bacterium]
MAKGKHAKGASRIGLCVRIALVVFVAAALCGTGGIAAKYIQETGGINIFTAKEFYFSSNLLEKGGAEYILNSDTHMLPIVLTNSDDGLRSADDPVLFEVGVAGDLATLSITTGTLAAGGVSEEVVALSGMIPGGTYTIAATGSAGYSKTLSATFKVSDGGKNVYKHVALVGVNCVELTVWAQNVKGSLDVEFPAGLAPDSIDPVLAAVDNYSGGAYVASSFADAASFASTYSSRTYRFFLSGASSVDASDFTVTLTDADGPHVADSGTPS